MEQILSEVRATIEKHGFETYDNRLKRKVMELRDYETCVTGELEQLSKIKILDKYHEDWKRMYRTFKHACDLIKADPTTRRAMVLNTNHYEKIYPCFLAFHFLQSYSDTAAKQDFYEMVIYQRSSDIDKLMDDLVFFAYVARKFEKSTGKKVNAIRIRHGSLHQTKK